MKIEDLNKNDKIVLAKNTTNRELLKVLAKENDKDVKYQIARNENTPIEVLENLNNYIYKDALNENYSFKKYIELMNDENFSKMETIKKEAIIKMFKLINENQSLDEKVCSSFINLNYKPLLKEIASYEKTPIEVLEKLSKNEDEVVRNKAINHKNYSSSLIEKLINLNDFESDF